MARAPSVFADTRLVVSAAIALRVGLLIYGHFQDQWSALKYTDVDYYVFTDAARYVSAGESPYARDTYRYTPLLAWLLYPTSFPGMWFDFGKLVFAGSDIVAGLLLQRILQSQFKMSNESAIKYASIWLLNPMVAQISTRGSSEGLLAALVMALVLAVMQHQYRWAGLLLGFVVHLKIYPFIYAASIVCWLAPESRASQTASFPFSALTVPRITVAIYSFLSFMLLNTVMAYIYGEPFIHETFLYHFIRTDHRHNFSPYNMLLYLNFAPNASTSSHPETLAFIPQLLLSVVIIPLALSKKSLPGTMLLQTFLFVTYNKVCTSQYFLWYLVFLPLHLPQSKLLQNGRLGLAALSLWILGQAAWLQQGYELEFLGKSSFMPGLWVASLGFHLVNVWIASILITDISALPSK